MAFFFKIQLTAAQWRATSRGLCRYAIKITSVVGWNQGQQAPVSLLEFWAQINFVVFF